MPDRSNGRRAFLAATGQLAGAGWLALHAPQLLAAGAAAAAQRDAGGAWRHMTAAEAAGFAAVADQIIPPDDLPGAAEAGVVHFLDTVLGGFMADAAPLLKQGLADLDARAAALDGGADRFAALPFDRQTAVLQAVETTPFFERMIFLTHCGMFAMPSWGGNRGKAGWTLLGFDDRHAWQPPFGYYDAQAVAGGNPHDKG